MSGHPTGIAPALVEYEKAVDVVEAEGGAAMPAKGVEDTGSALADERHRTEAVAQHDVGHP